MRLFVPVEPAKIIADTCHWLEQAVIGLNLCPFAKAVHAKGQIHFAVSQAESPEQLLKDLKIELLGLVASDPQLRETTLLIAPGCLPEFLMFNDFLDRANQLLAGLDLEGVVQIAPFHPDFEFADAAPGDITNFTNRAPYPILHLLRESSVARAVHAFGPPATIFEKNKATMRALGLDGWHRLKVGASGSDGR